MLALPLSVWYCTVPVCCLSCDCDAHGMWMWSPFGVLHMVKRVCHRQVCCGYQVFPGGECVQLLTAASDLALYVVGIVGA